MLRNIILALLLALIPAAAFAGSVHFTGESISVSASNVSSNAHFTTNASQNAVEVVVYNSGSTDAYVYCDAASGTVAQVPASGTIKSWLAPAGAIMYVYKGPATYCAAITSSGTTTVTFSSAYNSP